MTEDDQLMVRLQSGDAGAFDVLVNKYQGQLFGFFLNNLRDPQLAEDLTQETLLKVHNQFWDYLPVGRFRGWLYRIARNLMIDNIRRRSNDCLVRAIKSRGGDEDDMLARLVGEVIQPEESLDQQELAELINRLLAEIPEDQRLTFTLHHYSELPLPEVAEIMEANVPTTKSRLRLAREKLREKLKPYGIRSSELSEQSVTENDADSYDV